MTRHELGYDVQGPEDAPVVVLGSSLGTTRTAWDPQLPTLTEQFRVVRYDHLGHGESAVPPGPYALAGLASSLAGLLSEIGIERAHVAGLSLGGMVSLQLAARYPHLVERVAIVGSSAYLPPAQTWLDRAAAVRESGMAAVADTVLSRWFTAGFQDSQQAKDVRADLLSTPPEGYAGCCEAIATMDLRPVLSHVRAPTLAVVGTEDPATPVEHSRTVVEGVSGPARLETVEGAAHLASIERPEDVGALLVGHFSSKA